MAAIADADTFFAADRAAWRAWLEAHHGTATVVWLLLHKRNADETSVTYDEAVEEALCWGWIDGLTNRWDERSYAVRFTPRKPASVWSESNVERVTRMIAEGRMTAAGMALVDEAKRRGTWDEAASGRLEVTPPDLEAALAGVPAASVRWEAWAPTNRRQYVYWVLDAKRPETRARRIADVVRRAAAGIRPGERD
ncbi:MAG TPA: YdeI/OmpD-associated family protein [Thermoleophilia bacterium]